MKWWVVWIVDTARTGRQVSYAIERARTAAAASQIVANAGNVISHVDGPFPTRHQAQLDANTAPPGTKPVSANPVIKTLTGGGLGLPGLPGWNFISALSSPRFWLRAAEVVGGLVLLIVGLGQMTGLGKTVTEVVKNAPKVIPI